jgi:hypothetical protein
MDGDGEWLTSGEVARHLRISVYQVDDEELATSGEAQLCDYINFSDSAGNAKLGKSPAVASPDSGPSAT